MNRIGIHGLVWSGSWEAAACEHAIASSKEAGFDLIELPVFQPRSLDIDAIRRLLERHDLGVTCSLGLSFDTDISSTDPEVVARGEQLLGEALSAARDMGSRYLGGVIFSALAPYPDMPTEAGRQNSIAAIRRLAANAAASDISVGLEYVNRYESNLLNTCEQTMAFIAEVGAPNVVVHLDAYHMNIEEDDFRKPVVTAGDRLGYVHIGENHRGYLGSGHVDFPQLFRALVEHGYDGVITFESFSSAVVSADLSRTLRIWRDVWTDGADLAREARRYIAEQLEAARVPAHA